MYLSLRVSPSLCHLTVTSLLPAAARRSLPLPLSLFLSIIPFTRSFHLPSAFVFLPFHRSSNCKPLCVYIPLLHLHMQQCFVYQRTSLHAASLFLSFSLSLHVFYVLTHIYFISFFALLSSSSCCARRFSLSLYCIHRYIPPTHTNDVASQPRRIGPSVASVLRVLTPTSPLAYCFREFDEILPRDANVSPCTFFSTRQLVIRS